MRVRTDFSSANSVLAYLQFSELPRRKSKSQQRVLFECWFCTCSGCCWLLQRCMIMGNKDNICPQSQERTNILSTSKSSLIWQGRRSGMLSCTHVSWWGQERGFWGKSSTCANLTFQYRGSYPLQRDLSVTIPNTSIFPSSPADTPHTKVTANVPPCCLVHIQMWKPGLGLRKVGYYCGYFWGDEDLPCCYVCFYSLILHH